MSKGIKAEILLPTGVECYDYTNKIDCPCKREVIVHEKVFCRLFTVNNEGKQCERLPMSESDDPMKCDQCIKKYGTGEEKE